MGKSEWGGGKGVCEWGGIRVGEWGGGGGGGGGWRLYLFGFLDKRQLSSTVQTVVYYQSRR